MSVFLVSFLLLIPILLLLRTRSKPSKRIPPGSLGIPIIGQSLGLLRAMRANTAENWVGERIKKYGPVSKLSLFGKPTVLIYGQAANKFMFSSGGDTIANQQTQSIKMILGDRSLLELSGVDHSRVRGALISFLKPDSSFEALMEGMWSVPVNVPFTRYNRSLRESARIQNMLKEIVHMKKIEQEKNGASAHQDLISCLLGMYDEDGKQVITEKEIIQNCMLVMVAGHDTSSILITFIVRLLANEPDICAAVLQEQEEIAKGKPSGGEPLTWEDLSKMKYTWRVAQETLRMVPPVFGGFRKA